MDQLFAKGLFSMMCLLPCNVFLDGLAGRRTHSESGLAFLPAEVRNTGGAGTHRPICF